MRDRVFTGDTLLIRGPVEPISRMGSDARSMS